MKSSVLIFTGIIGSVFIAYHYISYLKKTRGSDNFAKRKAITQLFLGFVTLTGLSSIFADALFDVLGLNKPMFFEVYAISAYIIFAIASVKIMNGNRRENKDDGDSKLVTQKHKGNGDNVAGNKVINNNSSNSKINL